jgi:CxxC motif-containing protein (DUF1111 family)
MVRKPIALVAAAGAVTALCAAAPGLDAVIGRAVFERVWVAGGASTRAADGLGPLHNARSCAGCHGGGGAAALSVDAAGAVAGPGLVVRLADAGGAPDPVYGHQIQTRSLPGRPAEARLAFAVVPAGENEPGPRVRPALTDLGYGALAPGSGVGMRQAPSLKGRGDFEDVDPAAVLARADPNDADGDGVSGRARLVASPDGGGAVLGRYGWRASGATLADEISSAFSLDLGLSTPARPDPAGECTAAETACRDARHGDRDSVADTEVGAELVRLVTHYVASLEARPAAAGRGLDLFSAAGCAACHVPELARRGGGTVPAFTDLLLHDLGPGLADAATEPGVAPDEWRTAPLFDLAARRPATRRYLHDGRAGSIEEAVLWHDGEAATARARFDALEAGERAALLSFLERL